MKGYITYIYIGTIGKTKILLEKWVFMSNPFMYPEESISERNDSVLYLTSNKMRTQDIYLLAMITYQWPLWKLFWWRKWSRPWTSSRLRVSRRDFGDPLWILCHLLSTPKRHSQDPCREFSAKWHSVAHWSVTRKAFIQHDASWPHDSLLWKQEVPSHESLFFSDDCFFGDRTAWDF